ncbi:MAG: helix-turn-helix transcriptional regulator [Bacteroides sp.]|nr:helix-turn-helix transcriptional regulator [Bacteroides sp.]MBD5342955.1 helix-turn-helix transcriptional regulator [Bacteroides sp.]MBD5351543.1 helix-turn-helix transcriptional regulator [Bacteroides sp.]MBD5360053.1 helix-turn-helix transcriptional regulator [Bacteroides sp.]MBD5361964.1 helix-turn-helix transcriptional regulator [Bacteroides sp.]
MKSEHYDSNMKMREVIADTPVLLMALSRFNIPLGFGDETIAQVCARAAVDTNTFLAVASLIAGRKLPLQPVSLTDLMTYLRRAHSYFIDYHLPQIRRKLIDAVNYSSGEAVALVILKFFDDYVCEVRNHMEHENTEVFTYVDGLIQGRRDPEYSIERFLKTHEPIATKLHELKDIFICHYQGTGADVNRLNSVLFDIINCETDLMSHCEVENRIFVPAVRELERSVGNAQLAETDPDTDSESKDPEVHNLTDREKDIVRSIARGLSNKEIAERLCVSVHTVATHRRNICAKLDIHSAAGLTVFAIIHHLIPISEIKNEKLKM